MGSFESHQSSGGFSGDSQPDSDGPTLTFLTPDLLERSWRSLEPSSGLPEQLRMLRDILGRESSFNVDQAGKRDDQVHRKVEGEIAF